MNYILFEENRHSLKLNLEMESFLLQKKFIQTITQKSIETQNSTHPFSTNLLLSFDFSLISSSFVSFFLVALLNTFPKIGIKSNSRKLWKESYTNVSIFFNVFSLHLLCTSSHKLPIKCHRSQTNAFFSS